MILKKHLRVLSSFFRLCLQMSSSMEKNSENSFVMAEKMQVFTIHENVR